MTQKQWRQRMSKLIAAYDPFDNLGHFEKLILEPKPVISTWKEFTTWCEPFNQRGCFRGQSDASKPLSSSFLRKVYKRWEGEHSVSVDYINPIENERALLRQFQQAAHHHYSNLPDEDQVVDWLALMQHHGAPTRMLDWSRSPYVALYFAMKDGENFRRDAKEDEDAAMWAIDLDWLKQRSHALLREKFSDFPDDSDGSVIAAYLNRILLNHDNPHIVVAAAPKQLNERILIQQGELLCSLQHEPPFFVVLLGMLIKPNPPDRPVVSRVNIKKERRLEFLEELRRMNIHEASLFPGLDGFGRSLGLNLDIEVGHQIGKMQRQTFGEFKRLRKKMEKAGVI